MNILDMIIIAVMAFFLIRGIYRGFFREIGSLAGVVLGLWAAYTYQQPLIEVFRSFLPESKALPLICFALIFAAVLVLCNLVCLWLHKAFKRAALGGTDRLLGAILACLKGLVLVYVGIVLITFFVPSQSSLIANSTLTPYIVSSYRTLAGFISEEAYDNFRKKFTGQTQELGEYLSGKKPLPVP